MTPYLRSKKRSMTTSNIFKEVSEEIFKQKEHQIQGKSGKKLECLKNPKEANECTKRSLGRRVNRKRDANKSYIAFRYENNYGSQYDCLSYSINSSFLLTEFQFCLGGNAFNSRE
jgi:hypothetical protein